MSRRPVAASFKFGTSGGAKYFLRATVYNLLLSLSHSTFSIYGVIFETRPVLYGGGCVVLSRHMLARILRSLHLTFLAIFMG